MGIVLQNHLSSSAENDRQTSQPTRHPPDQTRRNNALMVAVSNGPMARFFRGFVRTLGTRFDGVTDQTASVPHHGAIGGVVVIRYCLANVTRQGVAKRL